MSEIKRERTGGKEREQGDGRRAQERRERHRTRGEKERGKSE